MPRNSLSIRNRSEILFLRKLFTDTAARRDDKMKRVLKRLYVLKIYAKIWLEKRPFSLG